MPPRAGIEQHRGDREIEFGARPRGGRGPGRLPGALGPQVARADHEMAPARVERHVHVGVVDADQLGDDLRGGRKAFDVDGEMLEPPRSPATSISCARSRTAAADSSERAASASPNQNSSILRPTVAFSSSAVGAWARNSRRPSSPPSRPWRRRGSVRRGSARARRSRCRSRSAHRASCSTSTRSGRSW